MVEYILQSKSASCIVRHLGHGFGHTCNLMAHTIWSCWNALLGRAVLHFPWIGVTHWFVTVMFAGWQVNRWMHYDSTGTTACTCPTHLSDCTHTHARSLQTKRFTQNGLLACLCILMCVDLYVYTQIRFYIQDIKMPLWPDGVLVIWAFCFRSNCNFASGGIAARQTDGMSYINIFLLEALLLSVGRVVCVCCTDVRRSYLLTSKPGLCKCNA